VLKDTHWIGGDPGHLDIYGWASWTPAKGIVVLRNPSDKTQEFPLDIAKAFELPQHAVRSYRAHSPWTADKQNAAIRLDAGRISVLTLKPFEVITLEANPAN
jgi:hypothetical protein